MCLSELFCTVSAPPAIENWTTERTSDIFQQTPRPRISPNTRPGIKPLREFMGDFSYFYYLFISGFMLHFRSLEKAHKITQLNQTQY
jgi:hypothetical protein